MSKKQTNNNTKTVGTRWVPADSPELRATKDLLHIYQANYYINEKGYLQKLVELLYNLGYYNHNKSIFS